MAIDYGLKRVGVAVTDPLQMIASPLETVPQQEIYQFLTRYFEQEEVEAIVLGWPQNLKGEDTDATQPVRNFISKLQEKFPQIPIHKVDERLTSRMAVAAMIQGGSSKKDRRNKSNIDKVSATIILQSYLEQNSL